MGPLFPALRDGMGALSTTTTTLLLLLYHPPLKFQLDPVIVPHISNMLK